MGKIRANASIINTSSFVDTDDSRIELSREEKREIEQKDDSWKQHSNKAKKKVTTNKKILKEKRIQRIEERQQKKNNKIKETQKRKSEGWK